MQTENQRERLVELLNEATFGVNVHTLADHLSRETIERVAEYLMANNVVVLPCKVGDTVYCIWKYSDFAKEDIPFIQESRVSGFVIEDYVTQIIPENYGEMIDLWHLLLDVAFTKEEAEKKWSQLIELNPLVEGKTIEIPRWRYEE
ncbi:MAG: hypothetical protein U0L88_13715 [Acutalibacteraceae bacterium]|nr:hypothetical protein [Acutalibacteraceae bacterium]